MPEPMLERSVLERKERDELHTIAEALGVKPAARTKKADLIQTILVAAGVEPAPEADEAPAKPKRASRTSRAAAAEPEPEPEVEAHAEEEPSANGIVAETGNGDADQAEAIGVDDAIEQAIDEGQAPVSSEGSSSTNGQSYEPRRNPEPRGQQPNTNGNGNVNGGGGGPRQPQPVGAGQPAQGGGGQQPGGFDDGGSRRSRRRRGRDKTNDRDFRVQEQNAEAQYQGELVPVSGLLDLTDQGYGYVRTKGYLPSSRDVYVSTSQAKRFALL
jgi:transcription termination factor Rho